MAFRSPPTALRLLFVGSFAAASFAEEASVLNLEAPTLAAPSAPRSKSIWERLTPSLDARMLLLIKENPSAAGREGFAVMQGIVGLDFELGSELSAVTRYNLGFLGTGPRELYFDYHNSFLDSVKLGRFALPFAFRLSDHRIYTKKFFGVSVNDFETGLEVAKAFGDLSLKIGLVQGLGSGEAFLSNELLLTPTLDLRYDFSLGEINNTVGTSFFRTLRVAGTPRNSDNSTAASLFARAQWWRLAFLAEFIFGHRRNALETSEIASFTGSSDYANAVASAESMALLAQLEYGILPSLKSFYEYDQLVFDVRYQADRFQKHVLGLRWAFHQAAEVELRFEKALEGRDSAPDLRLANDAVIITMHAWF